MKTVFTLMLALGTLFAAEPIVSAQWLHDHLDAKTLRIVEVSDADAYAAGHIPGAVSTAIGKWRVNNGTYLEVRSAAEIEAEVRALGIDADTHVVLYAPVGVPKDFLKTSYLFWALKYYGLKSVSLLDGGQAAWTDAGYALSEAAVTVTPGTFTAKADPSKVADRTYVASRIGKVPMLDARPGDKYLGITPTATVKRDGHIEGAMSYSWNYSVEDDYRLKPADELAALFSEGYGLDKSEEVIVYCTGGLETSFNYFVLSGVLGYEKVRLYDASMKEWGNRDDTPMARYRYETFPR
jgi:thiosulfate/3-mercaptopyruvate sulfurtransferase